MINLLLTAAILKVSDVYCWLMVLTKNFGRSIFVLNLIQLALKLCLVSFIQNYLVEKRRAPFREDLHRRRFEICKPLNFTELLHLPEKIINKVILNFRMFSLVF